jgi:hypothetical protein
MPSDRWVLGGSFLKDVTLTLDYGKSCPGACPAEPHRARDTLARCRDLADASDAHPARCLGLNPPVEAPRRTLRATDGRPHEVPFVQLAAIAVVAAKMCCMICSASIDPLGILIRRGVSPLQFHPWLYLVHRCGEHYPSRGGLKSSWMSRRSQLGCN